MNDEPIATAPSLTPGLTTTHTQPSSSSPTGSSTDLEGLFQNLALKWKDDCRYFSSAVQIAEHPAYKAIIAMGEAVLPYILRDLRHAPDHWFVALGRITGANPVLPDHREKIGLMADDWLAWGQSQGHVVQIMNRQTTSS